MIGAALAVSEHDATSGGALLTLASIGLPQFDVPVGKGTFALEVVAEVVRAPFQPTRLPVTRIVARRRVQCAQRHLPARIVALLRTT